MTMGRKRTYEITKQDIVKAQTLCQGYKAAGGEYSHLGAVLGYCKSDVTNLMKGNGYNTRLVNAIITNEDYINSLIKARVALRKLERR